MKKFKTKVAKCGYPAGTPVLFDETKDKGKSGLLLCTVPNGGGLFYKEEELEEEVDVKRITA